jgi:hypothetical protein
MSELETTAAAHGNSHGPAGSVPVRQRRFVEYGLTLAWALNFALLIGLGGWIFADGQFMQRATADKIILYDISAFGESITQGAIEPMSSGRTLAFALIVAAAVGSFAIVFAGLFFGAVRHRRLHCWLTLMTLVAAWLNLWSTWPELAWAGAKWRVGRHVPSFELIAAPLRHRWPTEDGASKDLGAFSAYPIGQPRVLMRLTTSAPDDDTQYSAIERSNGGGLRFQLTGGEQGSWLEWHPAGEAPASFLGGLETDYALIRSSPLGRGWFLTRYQSQLAHAGKSAP